jgi:hypothetical protein
MPRSRLPQVDMRDQNRRRSRRGTPWTLALLTTGILLIPLSSKAQTLENGDFSRGAAIWKGDRKVIADPDDEKNKVLELTLTKTKPASFHQLIDTDGAAQFTVSLQVKGSKELAGGSPLTLRMTRPDTSFTWKDFPVGGTDWNTISWTFTKVNGAKKLDFLVEAPPGSGKLYFDNFTIGPVAPPVAVGPAIRRPPVTSEAPPAGLWLWMDAGNVASIYPEGRVVMGEQEAHWRWVDEAHGLLAIEWKSGKWLDTATLSQDGNTLHCKNNEGRQFNATRIPVPRPPADDPQAVQFVAGSEGAGAVVRGYIAGTYSRHNNELIVNIESGMIRARDPKKPPALIDIIPFLERFTTDRTRYIAGEWAQKIPIKQYVKGELTLSPSRSVITVKPHTDLSENMLAFCLFIGGDVDKPFDTRVYLRTPTYFFSETSKGPINR